MQELSKNHNDKSLLYAFFMAIAAGAFLVMILFAMGAVAYYGHKYNF